MVSRNCVSRIELKFEYLNLNISARVRFKNIPIKYSHGFPYFAFDVRLRIDESLNFRLPNDNKNTKTRKVVYCDCLVLFSDFSTNLHGIPVFGG